MRKICFITGSRADYGIMSGLMKLVKESPEAELTVIATNMHLSEKYGMTVNEIINDGFEISYRVDSMLKGDSPSDTVNSMAATMKGMAEAFSSLRPDLIVILGDRYEMLAAASAAATFNIPVAHLHGGESTEGAYDEFYRHAITKLSSIHFAATDLYAKRIVQMGENPEYIFSFGAPGVENILSSPLLPLPELEESIGFTLGDRYMVVTFHPETKSPGEEERQVRMLLESLQKFIPSGFKFLITLPNSDTGGEKVAKMLIEQATREPDYFHAVKSLGKTRFFSALKHSCAFIGNSSSGLIEAPALGIPSVNIGDRQKGRMSGSTVIHTTADVESITKAIDKALSKDFKEKISSLDLPIANPYYKPHTAENILDKLLHLSLPSTKSFHDLP